MQNLQRSLFQQLFSILFYNNLISTKSFNVKIWIIQSYYSLFKSHLIVQIWTDIYVEYFVNSYEIHLVEHFVRNNCDSTYCNFLNIKLHHGYFSRIITKFSEQVSLKYLQEEMSLVKYEDFLELPVEEFVKQSSRIFLGRIMCGVWKTKH